MAAAAPRVSPVQAAAVCPGTSPQGDSPSLCARGSQRAGGTLWTGCFASERKPLALISDWWTKISSLPSSGVMKPKPFWALNHFTVPVAAMINPAEGQSGQWREGVLIRGHRSWQKQSLAVRELVRTLGKPLCQVPEPTSRSSKLWGKQPITAHACWRGCVRGARVCGAPSPSEGAAPRWVRRRLTRWVVIV